MIESLNVWSLERSKECENDVQCGMITVWNVIELGDVINLEHVLQLRCSDAIDVSLIKDL